MRFPGWHEIFAKIEALLVDHPLGHRLTALIVVAGIVKITVHAGVQRAVALRTMIAETDPLFGIDSLPALPAVHETQGYLLRLKASW